MSCLFRMCERISALLTGWSLYRWTGVIMDRTLGPSLTVNSPQQVQLSLSIWSVVNVCPPVDWFTCFILNLDCLLAEEYLGIMNWLWWWLRTLNQTMVIVCVCDVGIIHQSASSLIQQPQQPELSEQPPLPQNYQILRKTSTIIAISDTFNTA